MEHTCACPDMQSYVNIRCHLETFQALSTNFGDNPRMMESPSSVDLSDENILGTLWAQLLLQFSTDCFETFKMFSAWNEDCIWFEYNLYFFLTFSAL